MVPVSYAEMQVLQQAIEATKSLDQDKLGEYIHANTFHTVFGDIKVFAWNRPCWPSIPSSLQRRHNSDSLGFVIQKFTPSLQAKA